MIRRAAVAGSFYPADREKLSALLRTLVQSGPEKRKAIAVISPHAGYVYSGPVAGAVFSAVQLPETCLLLGPSHRMIRSRAAIMREGRWVTPLGEIPVETALADKLLDEIPFVEVDAPAHDNEHSIEVQLPFIQYFRQYFSFVPISIGYQMSLDELVELGSGIAQALNFYKKETLIVASTDMSHYVDSEIAERLDHMAIDKIEAMAPEELHRTVLSNNISMCGFQPTVAAMVAAKALGATRASLIKYQTSGDITGDFGEVVGYAGLVIE